VYSLKYQTNKKHKLLVTLVGNGGYFGPTW